MRVTQAKSSMSKRKTTANPIKAREVGEGTHTPATYKTSRKMHSGQVWKGATASIVKKSFTQEIGKNLRLLYEEGSKQNSQQQQKKSVGRKYFQCHEAGIHSRDLIVDVIKVSVAVGRIARIRACERRLLPTNTPHCLRAPCQPGSFDDVITTLGGLYHRSRRCS